MATASTFIMSASLLETIFFNKNKKKTLDDTVSVMFTSGSTGVPTAVVLMERNILSNVQAIEMVLKYWQHDRRNGHKM